MVQDAVASGRYESQQEILNDALTLWKKREEELDKLRAEIQIGIDQLDRGESIDGEIVHQELREKLARLKEAPK